MTTVEDQLAEALAALPTEPDEIARVFAELGIKGTPGAAGGCPVARYLKAETGQPDAAVGPVNAYAQDASAPLPYHVWQFVYRFDGCQYPQLEDPS